MNFHSLLKQNKKIFKVKVREINKDRKDINCIIISFLKPSKEIIEIIKPKIYKKLYIKYLFKKININNMSLYEGEKEIIGGLFTLNKKLDFLKNKIVSLIIIG